MNSRHVLAATAAAAMLLVGAGTPSPIRPASGQSVAQATPRSCSANGLSVVISWNKAGTGLPGGGGLEGQILFAKKGAGTCTLSGWPRVRVLDAQGHRLTMGERRISPPRGLPAVTLNIMVSPPQRATASLEWLNWCKGAISRPISIAMRLPHRTTFHRFALASGARLTASCVNPTASSVVDIGPILPAK